MDPQKECLYEGISTKHKKVFANDRKEEQLTGILYN